MSFSLKFNPEKSDDHCQTFTVIPDKYTQKRESDRLSELQKLISLLPEGEGYEEQMMDYPQPNPALMRGTIVHYSLRRPLFSIAGIPFFRRYNDNWNATVVQGKIKNGYIDWIPGGMPHSGILELIDLIETHGIQNLTMDQVLEAARG